MGVDTDTALASELGVERSAVAQWRRRGVPVRYRPLIDAPTIDGAARAAVRLATRRNVYGDGAGRYVLAAALAVIPTSALDYPAEISDANIGWSRESLIMNVVQAVLRVADGVLGKQRCDTDGEFIKLVNALSEPANRLAIEQALQLPSIGEL